MSAEHPSGRERLISGMAAWGALLTALCLLRPADAQTPATVRDGVGVDQQIGAELPRQLKLRDEAGATVMLGDFFRDQPVLLMPVYYRCPMLCGLELNGLVRCLRAMELQPGRDFQIVTFSIDPREPSTLAATRKQRSLKEYGRAGAGEGWHFLTGDAAEIEQLCDSLGFRTVYDTDTGQYAHAAAAMIATPRGRLARYLYGVEFAPRDLRLALVEASRNELGDVTDQVLLFCYLYDPTTGKYGLAIMNLVRAAGVLTVLVIAGGIGGLLWRERHLRMAGLHLDEHPAEGGEL